MLPTRSLTDQVKPHRYVPACHTDVRRTFRKFRLLAVLQRNKVCPDCGWEFNRDCETCLGTLDAQPR